MISISKGCTTCTSPEGIPNLATVRVLMPTYNRAHRVDRAITGALAQTIFAEDVLSEYELATIRRTGMRTSLKPTAEAA